MDHLAKGARRHQLSRGQRRQIFFIDACSSLPLWRPPLRPPSARAWRFTEFGMDQGTTRALAYAVQFRSSDRLRRRSDLICNSWKIFLLVRRAKTARRCKRYSFCPLVPVSQRRAALSYITRPINRRRPHHRSFRIPHRGVRENSSPGQVSCLDAFKASFISSAEISYFRQCHYMA